MQNSENFPANLWKKSQLKPFRYGTIIVKTLWKRGEKQGAKEVEGISVEKEDQDMKVQNINDMDKFFQVIESCGGKVELVTGEGDRLNLKSKLCQYISLANIFSNAERIPELEIVAHEPEDIEKLLEFLVNE